MKVKLFGIIWEGEINGFEDLKYNEWNPHSYVINNKSVHIEEFPPSPRGIIKWTLALIIQLQRDVAFVTSGVCIQALTNLGHLSLTSVDGLNIINPDPKLVYVYSRC